MTYPMDWADFAGLMPILSAPWRLRRFEQITWSGGAVPDVSEMADPRWSCRVTLDVMDLDAAIEMQALIEMHGSAHPFLLHDPARLAPRLDPGGIVYGSSTPILLSVAPGGVAVSGLPAGYVLSRGDRLDIDHGSTRAIYSVAAPTTADGAGITPLIPLMPPPRTLAAIGQAANLVRPVGSMVILPDSYDPGQHSGGVVRGIQFDAVEAW